MKSNKYSLFFLLPWQGGAKFCHASFELALSGCSLAGPFSLQAASAWSCCIITKAMEKETLNQQQVCQQKGKSKCEVSGGPLGQLMLMSGCQGCLLILAWGTSCTGVVCGNGERGSESWALVLCTVNGTLVQQLLLLCLKICHSSPVILSDPRDPFNFVFIKMAALHF